MLASLGIVFAFLLVFFTCCISCCCCRSKKISMREKYERFGVSDDTLPRTVTPMNGSGWGCDCCGYDET